MKIGLIGLGRMGSKMGARWIRKGHEVVGFARHHETVQAAEALGIQGAGSIAEMVKQLPTPRVVWVMVPAGEATDTTLQQVAGLLSAGDIIIDGGNSYFKDDLRHAEELAKNGIDFMDVGTSGGIWGEERGYCLMIGGTESAFKKCQPIFEALAPGIGEIPRTEGRNGAASNSEKGYLHCGPVGSGHFVKMVHNGIEYGIMQSFSEGFQIIQSAADKSYLGRDWSFKTSEIAEVWRRGSVISSWLLDLIAISLQKDPTLSHLKGQVPDSGEGRWTVLTAVEQGTPAHVLSSALYNRFQSREESSFANKLLSAMREGFGGHHE